MHKSVLLDKVIDLLQIKPYGMYLDCTAGYGGHANEIIKKLTSGKIILIDRDINAIKHLNEKFKNMKNVNILYQNFADFTSKELFDGILLDLGISSPQIDIKERGFSYRFDAPLDMRMNTNSDFSLIQWLKTHSYKEIEKIIYEYSDEKYALDIAKLISKKAKQNKLKTTFDLKNAIIEAKKGHGVKYSLRRVFQAFRILVNDELNNLNIFLKKTPSLLKAKGRIIVISYHSLEDRIVKYFFKESDKLSIINKKVIRPSYIEIQHNKRARSAKLRCAEKI